MKKTVVKAGRTGAVRGANNAVLKAISSVISLSVVAGSGFIFADPAYAGFDYTVIKPKVQVEVLYNARKIETPGGKAQLKDGSVFVPIRAVSETLGAKVAYSGKEVTITKEGKKIQLTIGTKRVLVNDKALTDIGASFTSAGSTMVPIRVISESFGEVVEWDSTNQFVWIGNKDIPQIDAVGELKSGKEFYSYLYKYPFMINNPLKEGEYVKVYLVDRSDYPFNADGRVFYRAEKTVNSKNEDYLALYTSYRGSFPMSISFLETDKKPRTRTEIRAMRSLGNTSVINYFPKIASVDMENYDDKDWERFDPSKPSYVYLTAFSDVAVISKNPWK
ncbi:copper amine oxidase N-terminal domain-containing protein [Paenibacillus pasadenensis]|uniref:copper amine oxidase N-terminal domain-containing protein n=1 Tax=Paenibacillus pasadenensis TaxID=217090 RepID=UPI001F0AA8A7|nr:copper amine oxidase N-terminal domain-containing protein [Paenibacillus pasadenensis]